MSSRFHAAIIIPHFNDVHRLTRCLEALMPQISADVEVVVVDNNSSDSLEVIRTTWPDLRIVCEPKKGAAEARNRGVAETSAEHLFFLDCDCVPEADWLSTARAHENAADVVGGRVSVFDESAPPRSGAQAFEAVFAFDNRDYVDSKGFSVTANLLTRREVFTATGPFVHGLSEDLDWCRRATAQGFGLIYLDALHVAHPSRGDWQALRRKWLRLTQESFGVNGTSGAARLRWSLRALAMPVSVLAHLPRVLKARALRGPQERFNGAVMLIRLRLQRMIWMLKQAMGGAIS